MSCMCGVLCVVVDAAWCCGSWVIVISIFLSMLLSRWVFWYIDRRLNEQTDLNTLPEVQKTKSREDIAPSYHRIPSQLRR